MSTYKNLTVCSLIGYKLKKTQHLLRTHMDEALRVLKLTTPQYAVLAQLEIKPGISNAALAREAFITAQTMHGIVANLEKQGLVKRSNDPEHGRILCTELTKQGVGIVRQAHKIIDRIEKSMTSSMSENKKALLEKLLVECFDNLNANKVVHYKEA